MEGLPPEVAVAALRLDEEGRILDCNAPFSALTGHTAAALRGRRPSELIAPCVRKDTRQLADGRYPVRAADGRCIDLVWTGARAESEANGGVLLAVPPQAEPTEDDAFAPEPCLRLLVEHATDGVAIIEPYGTLRYVSPAVRRILGYAPSDLIAHNVFAFIHPDDRDGVEQIFELGQQKPGEVGTREARFLHSDGSWRTLSFTGRWLTDQDVGQAMVVNFHDVTLLHEGARERERLVDAIAAAHDGIAFTDRFDRFVFVNEAHARIHGHHRSWFLGRRWKDVVVQDENDLEVTLDRTLRDPAVGIYTAEHTVVHEDGSLLFTEVTARGLFNGQGVYQGHICVVRDVTAQRIARAHAHHQAQILAQIHEAVVATDLEGTIQAWNHGAETLFATPAAAAIGRPIDEVISGPGQECFAKWTIETLAGGTHSDGLELVKSDGQAFWALMRRSALRETDGKPRGVIWTLLDITTQREAERALERRLRIDRTVANVSAGFVGVRDDGTFDVALYTAVEAIGQLTGSARAVFFEVTRGKVFTRFSSGPMTTSTKSKPLSKDSRSWLLGTLALGEALFVTDTTKLQQDLRDWLRARGTATAIFLPVCVGDTLVGIVLLEDIAEPHVWTYDSISLLMVAIDVVGQAIERRRALRAERAAQRQAASLHSALAALTSELDLEQVLARIMELFAMVMPGEGVALLLCDDEGVRIVDARGEVFDEVRGARVRISAPAVSDSNAECEGDCVESVRYSDVLKSIPLESWLEAPLRSRSQTIGYLIAISEQEGTFGKAEAELAQSFATQAAVAIDNARLFKALENAARTDALTGVANRRHILERSASELSRAQRYDHNLAAIMIDVDHFKQVNDTFGHAAGDAVLVTIAERCQAQLRATDEIGRYGGEEFVVLLPEADLARAIWVAERLRHAICGEPVIFEGGEVHITLSLGVAGLDPHCRDLDSLLRRADEALYAAKNSGRNLTCVWRRADIEVYRDTEGYDESGPEHRH